MVGSFNPSRWALSKGRKPSRSGCFSDTTDSPSTVAAHFVLNLRSVVRTLIILLGVLLLTVGATVGYYKACALLSPLGQTSTTDDEVRTLGKRFVNDGEPYTTEYQWLSPEAPVTMQRVLHPVLRNTARGRHEVQQNGGVFVRRYVLRGVEAGRQYMLRVCFLGSPSVGYYLRLYQVPTSRLQGDALTDDEPNDNTMQLLDTEVRIIRLHPTRTGEFASDEVVWFDLPGDLQGGREDDPWVPVVEVRPYVLGVPYDIEPFVYVGYNLHLNHLIYNIPDILLPYVVGLVVLGIAVGWKVVYKCVYRGECRGASLAETADNDLRAMA